MDERIPKLEAELERLQVQLDSLERDWKRVPFLSSLLVLAIPAAIVWGALAAALVIVGVASLMGTAAYLISVRKNEYRGEMETVKRDLRVLRERR